MNRSDPLFAQFLLRSLGLGFLFGVPGGIIAGLPIFVIGAFLGLPIGIIDGSACGLMAGALLGAVSRRFYNPLLPERKMQYRLVAAAIWSSIGVVITLAFGLSVLPTLKAFPGYVLAFQVVPALLAALISSQSVAAWYIRYQMSH